MKINQIFDFKFIYLGKICIDMLRSTSTWKSTNTLSEVINAVVNYIDNPNIDEAEDRS